MTARVFYDFDTVCPWCKRLQNRLANLPLTDTEIWGEPTPGDAVICSDCGAVNIVDSNRRLRKATPKEKAEIMAQLEKVSNYDDAHRDRV